MSTKNSTPLLQQLAQNARVKLMEQEVQIQGYGQLTLAQAKQKALEYIQRIGMEAQKDDVSAWRNIQHLAGNGMLNALCDAIIKQYETTQQQGSVDGQTNV